MNELIKKLAGAFGPAGSEEGIRSLIREEVEKVCDEVFVDDLGSLVAVKWGNAKKNILVAAHMDEIGFMVTFIDKNGFLRFTNIGGVLKNTLVGSRVVFSNGVTGVIGREKIEDGKEPGLNRLYIDIGARSREEASARVKIGDSSAFLAPVSLEGHRVISKALDDRIGCYVLIETLKSLPASLPCTLHFVFTVQEELGLRGARPVAYRLQPHFGLAVDVTRTGDTPEPDYKMNVSLGKGPAVKIKDSSIICHPQVVEMLVRTAEKEGIPYQMEVLERGGTDAGAIHLSREGVPTGGLSIPCRYIHTAGEMVDLDDVQNSIRLLAALFAENW